MSLPKLITPCLLLDRDTLGANAARLADRMGALGGVLRPHVKTHKSIDVTRDIMAAGNAQGITVSTLSEAEHFFAAGFRDIFYAVGIAPNKFAAAGSLIERGCDLKVTTDNLTIADLLATYGEAHHITFPVMIEVDTDQHRAGVEPEGDDLTALGQLLSSRKGVALHGVMTHAGESYNCHDHASLLSIARQERDLTLLAANRLRQMGLECPVVSIGSTPTAFTIDDLSGVTEVRAGVYATFDLVMVNIGVCTIADIALSVLVTIIGHQTARNWIITDGGWMAMSRDRGTLGQTQDYGYGAVMGAGGEQLPDLVMTSANQEHGIITTATGEPLNFDAFPIGSQLRILPNHACATAAQHEVIHIMENGNLTGSWTKCGGW